MQDADAERKLSAVFWEDEALTLTGSSYERAIETATREREWVIKAWAPPHLGDLLARWFWKVDRPMVSMNKVWLDTCKYPYMPRLLSADVFTKTVQDGVAHRNWFGYAASEKAGTLEGLIFGSSGGVYLNESALLVRPDAAIAGSVPP
jgi:hypothetical protein